MYEGDYFYSSAPSDISSDITIEISQGAESDQDLASLGGRGLRAGPRSRSPHPQSYQSVRPGPRRQQPSLGDKITRKLFRKKRKEMPGANLDR